MVETDIKPARCMTTREQGTQVDFPHYKTYNERRTKPRLLTHSTSAFCLTPELHAKGSQTAGPLRPRSLALPLRNPSSNSMASTGSWVQKHSTISIPKFEADELKSISPYTPPPQYQSKESNNQNGVRFHRDRTTPNEHGVEWRHLHMSRAKLKATATTSELLSGFAMIAMVELQVNDHSGAPQWLLVCFAISTTILVSVHIFALMVSTYLLPHIEAASKMSCSKALIESPHSRMRHFVELAWILSTVLGLFLFLLEIAILCWVKFWDISVRAAVAATGIVFPVLVIFMLFALYFHWSLVVKRVLCGGCYGNRSRNKRDSPV